MKSYINQLLIRKDLIKYLVITELKAQHKNSYLGFCWWLIDPLLQIFIYYFVVVIVFQRAKGAEYGVFLAIGLMVWRWLASSVTTSVRSIISQAALITQVYLPKAAFPICTILSQTINFGFGLIVILICFLIFNLKPGAAIVWLPFVIGIQFLFMLAIALFIAYTSVFVRDIEMITQHFMRLWFYGSPVIWYDNMIPEGGKWMLRINPMAGFLSGYRKIIIDNSAPDFSLLIVVGFVSIISILLLINHYQRFEHKIIKAL